MSYADQELPGPGDLLLLEFFCSSGKNAQIMAQKWECTCGIGVSTKHQGGIEQCSKTQIPVQYMHHGGMGGAVIKPLLPKGPKAPLTPLPIPK